MDRINYFTSDCCATIYWEKPEHAGGECTYRVLLNDKETAAVNRTHITIAGLQPETEYKAAAFYGEEEIGTVLLKTEAVKKIIDITRAPYFAVGDGKTMNTAAIQRAIDDCGPDQRVLIPEGIFMTGALCLHSNMELYLEKGAVLQGTDDPRDYLPRIHSRFEGLEMECYSSLLNMGELDHTAGPNCENIVIRGEGTIASGGRKLAKAVIEQEKERLKKELEALGDGVREYENENTIPGRVRPRLVNISNCRNILMSGVSFRDGASWNVQMIYSEGIVTHNCRFYSQNVWNGDGWDPDSSENCVIFGCTFYTGDDSIAVKSGKNPEGNVINRPTRHVRIFDCTSAYGHGITMGSEMSGGIEDVEIWDCDLSCGLYGIEIKGTKKRGGYVRGIHVRDTIAPRILFHSVGYNDDGIGAPKPPVFENCVFERVRLLGAFMGKSGVGEEGEWNPCQAIELCGFDVPGYEIKNIVFRDVRLGDPKKNGTQQISLKLCKGITFENIDGE